MITVLPVSEKLWQLVCNPEVSLKEARAKRDTVRKQIADGTDPVIKECFERDVYPWIGSRPLKDLSAVEV